MPVALTKAAVLLSSSRLPYSLSVRSVGSGHVSRLIASCSGKCCGRCSAVMMSALHGHISDSPTLNLLYMWALILNYLPCIKCFGLPISVSFPVYRNVSEDECLPLAAVSKGCASVLSVYNDVHMNQKRRDKSLSWPRTSGYRQKLVEQKRFSEPCSSIELRTLFCSSQRRRVSASTSF